ncbi:MAG TPA: hypothetical protein VHL11_03770, partial [Phototrophicaceae bacterium]|nr:hypothetical protein [Phototrophicaceae bacterium]
MGIRFWLKPVVYFAVIVTLVNVIMLSVAMPVGQRIPQGEKLAFMSRSDLSWDIFIMDVSRQLIRRITWDDDANERFPAWSPDGKQLAYHSDKLLHSGQYEIYIASLD